MKNWQMSYAARASHRLLAVVVAVALLFAVAPVAHAQGPLHSENAAPNQPEAFDGRIYGIDSDGSTVVVGGTFTTIGDSSGAPFTQRYLFKFDVSTGRIDRSFRPQFDAHVEAVAISNDGESLYVGGNFIRVDGTVRRRIAKLSMADGSLITEFTAHANSLISDIALKGDTLFVGGRVTRINGESVQRLAAVDTTSGDVLPDFTVPVLGTRNPLADPYIQEMDLSANGRWLVIGGNFTTVDGQPREQLAVLRVRSTSMALHSWFTDSYDHLCGRVRSTIIRGISIDPASEYFVVNTTGFHHGVDTLCDTAARFELPPGARGSDVEPTWATFTGGDTHWAVGVTEGAVYVGGHQRWENNPYPSPAGNNDGPGAVVRKGIAALDPLTGVPLSWNASRTPRGRGVEAIHAGDGFLFVGHDTTRWSGEPVERLAVLPIDPAWVNEAPVPVRLPATLHLVTRRHVMAFSFDGSNFGPRTDISGPDVDGINWREDRAAFVSNGKHISFRADDSYRQRSFDGSNFGPATNLSRTVGYVDQEDVTPFDQPLGVSEIDEAAYDSDGRLYYTKDDEDTVYWRWYSIESGIIGGQEFVAATNFGIEIRGMTIIDGQMYLANDNTTLTRHAVGNGVVSRTGTLIDDGSSGIDWRQIRGMFATN